MAALPDLITVEQFRLLPDDGERAYELHGGIVVAMSHPSEGHILIQANLLALLAPRLPGFRVNIEYPFRPLPQFELRRADVSAVSRERAQKVERKDNLAGSPDLVIEVRSPSNSERHLQAYASLCLASGSIQFWIAEDSAKLVTVIDRNGTRRVYRSGESIPLEAFGGGVVHVDEIFA